MISESSACMAPTLQGPWVGSRLAFLAGVTYVALGHIHFSRETRLPEARSSTSSSPVAETYFGADGSLCEMIFPPSTTSSLPSKISQCCSSLRTKCDFGRAMISSEALQPLTNVRKRADNVLSLLSGRETHGAGTTQGTECLDSIRGIPGQDGHKSLPRTPTLKLSHRIRIL